MASHESQWATIPSFTAGCTRNPAACTLSALVPTAGSQRWEVTKEEWDEAISDALF